MPQVTAQDSILISKVQEALTQGALDYAPHTIGGLGTGLISLGLILWRTGILRGIINNANLNKKLDNANPEDKSATVRDVKQLIRENEDIIGREYGTHREHQKEVRDLTELLNKLAQNREIDRKDMSEKLSKLLENSHEQALTIARIQTSLRGLLPPETF